MKHRDAMARYLEAFNKNDLDGILSLFSEDALVYSPTQPDQAAVLFVVEHKGRTTDCSTRARTGARLS